MQNDKNAGASVMHFAFSVLHFAFLLLSPSKTAAGKPLGEGVFHYAILLAVGSLCCLVNLGGPSLWDLDEGRNATAAYEMMLAGDWIVPTFNSRLRVDKPVLLYWLQIIGYYAFGVNEFAARLPSAAAAIVTLLVCYELGRCMFGAASGLLAGLVLACSPLFCAAARFANPDALLNLFSSLTLFVFWIGFVRGERRGARDENERRRLFSPLAPHASPLSLGVAAFVALGASAALAVLAKGPVGLALPGLAALLFLLWSGRLGVVINRRLLLGIAVFIAVAGPWYVMVTVATKGDFARGFFLKHNLERFQSTMESHHGGPLYYMVVLLAGMLPLSVFLPAALWRSLAVLRGKDSDEGKHSSAYRFLWCWIASYLVFFTLSATKLPNYVLPIYVPAAVLLGRFLDRWRCGALTLPRWHMPVALSAFGLFGVLVSAGLAVAGGMIDVPALRGRHIAGLANWACLGLIPVAGAAAAWQCYRRKQRTALLGSLSASAVCMLALLAGFALLVLDQCKACRALVEQAGAPLTPLPLAKRGEGVEVVVGCLHLEHLPSLNFYCKRDIRHCRSEADMAELLHHPLPIYLFMPAPTWQKLAATTVPTLRVVARQRDMYKNREVVVVTNGATTQALQFSSRALNVP